MAAKSLMKYSSEHGLWMGLFLSVASLCLLCSVYIPSLVMLLPLAVLAWPIVIWALVRRIWTEEPAHRNAGAMAFAGMWTCFFGALIASAFSLAWIMLVQPDFLHLLLAQSVEAAEQAASQDPSLAQQVEALTSTLKNGVAPAPAKWVVSMLMLTMMAGTIFSAGVAAAINFRKYS